MLSAAVVIGTLKVYNPHSDNYHEMSALIFYKNSKKKKKKIIIIVPSASVVNAYMKFQ